MSPLRFRAATDGNESQETGTPFDAGTLLARVEGFARRAGAVAAGWEKLRDCPFENPLAVDRHHRDRHQPLALGVRELVHRGPVLFDDDGARCRLFPSWRGVLFRFAHGGTVHPRRVRVKGNSRAKRVKQRTPLDFGGKRCTLAEMVLARVKAGRSQSRKSLAMKEVEAKGVEPLS